MEKKINIYTKKYKYTQKKTNKIIIKNEANKIPEKKKIAKNYKST